MQLKHTAAASAGLQKISHHDPPSTPVMSNGSSCLQNNPWYFRLFLHITFASFTALSWHLDKCQQQSSATQPYTAKALCRACAPDTVGTAVLKNPVLPLMKPTLAASMSRSLSCHMLTHLACGVSK